MKLFTQEILNKLLRNGVESETARNKDGATPYHWPVVRLFTPDANATWLLSEITPDDHNIAFGLCDLGMGEPELGYVDLEDLARLRGCLGLPVERDRLFKADRSLMAYWEASR